MQALKKVLVITYYWPPSGGSGVQRWLKFVKYLPSCGWTPVVYAPDGGEMPVEDHSLEKDIPPGTEIIRQPIWEPYELYKKWSGRKGEKVNTGFLSENKKPGLADKIAIWVRGNLFIPDARRFWIKPSIRFLRQYLRDNPVDAIVTTGPPHSMHLIGRALKKHTGLPWIADFRDPWTNIDFYQDLMLTRYADRLHHKLERAVLTEADCVISVGPTLGKELQALGAKRVEVITNGYDEDDYPVSPSQPDAKFSIAHVGTMVKTRNPVALWKALQQLITEQPAFASDLEIKLVGKVDLSVMASIKEHGLTPYLRKIDYLPHEEAIIELTRSRLLLLVLNDTPNARGILTGKFFEYLGAKRPVLCIGDPEGDVGKILANMGAEAMACLQDEANIKTFIQRLYVSRSTAVEINIDLFSRRQLTRTLSQVIKEFTG
ncbi:MAG: glycosyltransferase family 4 protein [Flavobacteriales bacterium]|nr:glycosyltransferase family 4 protein [Flavobacteriales bacterium]